MMWGTDVIRSQHEPFRIEPCRGQVTEHGPEVARAEKPRHIFEERQRRSRLDQYANGVGPHIARVASPPLFSGDAERLTGEPGGDNVAAPGHGVEGPHISMDGHAGEADGKHALAVGVAFDEPDRLPPEDETAEQSAPGPREEGELAHLTLHLR